MADPQEGAILVGAVPAKGAIRAGAAVAPVAVIGLGTGGSGKDREFGQRVKGGMRQLASLECQPQENRGMACEEHECQAPADPRLVEPDVQDHWGQCLQRFAWGRRGGALDTCGEVPPG